MVDDMEKEYARLKDLGGAFSKSRTAMGPVKIAVLDGTCGNRIQLFQVMAAA